MSEVEARSELPTHQRTMAGNAARKSDISRGPFIFNFNCFSVPLTPLEFSSHPPDEVFFVWISLKNSFNVPAVLQLLRAAYFCIPL